MLDKIVEKTKIRLENYDDSFKDKIDESAISFDFPFEKALREKPIAIISEVKRASPSKGLIAEDFDYVSIAREYEDSGASAISVLTEPDFFKGSIKYLAEIADEVDIPVLRKDFIIDPVMIYEAKVSGASAVLLIVAILNDEQLREYLDLAHSLGLSALVEAHDEKEIERALMAGARVIGVNNRNLKDFTVDINNSINLRRLVPENVIFISESGIKTAEDVGKLKDNKIDGVLIGETLMRSNNKRELIQELKNG